jgi:phosphatidate cytidylyltransferase
LKNLLTRTLTGTLYLAVFIGALLLGKYTFFALFLAISLIALWEFYAMVILMGHQPMKYLGMFIDTALFLLVFEICSRNLPLSFILFFVPAIVFVFILELYRNKSNPMSNISFTLLGILYVSMPLILFNKLAFYFSQEYNYQIILGFFILLWINDVFAFIFGISFGKHKLFERVSPKKSWEGFFGGTLITLIAAYILGTPFFLLNRTDWMIIGLIISIAGVFGDLTESLFKRTAEIKDSGKILPGHGGMLDRIDSVLLSSPLVFAYLMLINQF